MCKISSGHSIVSNDSVSGQRRPEQTARLRSLILAFAVHICSETHFRIALPHLSSLFYATNFGSAAAQIDLGLRWGHISEGTFSDVVAHIYVTRIVKVGRDEGVWVTDNMQSSEEILNISNLLIAKSEMVTMGIIDLMNVYRV